MIDLDDVAALGAADPSDSLGSVERAHEQWRRGLDRVAAVGDLPTRHGLQNVVWCGMGGSAAAGDVLAALARPHASVPVAVVRGYELPAYVGANTAVVLCSYSGNTEETLACFDQALHRRARVIVICGGGVLSDMAAEHRRVVIEPDAGQQPRFAFWSMLAPAMAIAERLALVPGIGPALEETERVLAGRIRSLSREVPARNNEAKMLAEELNGQVPWVWGQDGWLAAVANRWHTQFNENAKVPAFTSVIPELDHNELAGFHPGLPTLSALAVVLLRSDDEAPAMRKRIDATLEETRPRVGRVFETWSVGETPLARLASLMILGDFTSVYLAALRRVDPTPVQVIESLKLRLV